MLQQGAVIQVISSQRQIQNIFTQTCGTPVSNRLPDSSRSEPKWRGVLDVYRLGSLNAHTRGNQSDRNCIWIDSDVRIAALATDGWLDVNLPGHHRGYQRDWILLSLSQAVALAHSRRNFPGVAGIRNHWPLQVPARGSLAADLFRHCGSLIVAECFRAGRATLHEGAGASPACSYGFRTAIPDLPNRGHGYLHRAGSSGRKEFPR